MDILNWLRIKKQNLIRTTLDSPKDLVVLGADVSYQKRGDKYQSYAMPAEDFLATAARPYKVYTALLTQSGGSVPNSVLGDESFYKGVTYTITANPDNVDISSIGAPNNNVGTSFVATRDAAGEFPINLTASYNIGAPVVTVLENTIGNIWFTYGSPGAYLVNSSSLFTNNKSSMLVGNVTWDGGSGTILSGLDGDSFGIIITVNTTTGIADNNGALLNTLIEIRVYN